MDDQGDLQALKDFILDKDSLEAIEDDFNVFIALKIEKNEIRHPNFLARLLDPSSGHGVGGYFLSTFLKSIATRV